MAHDRVMLGASAQGLASVPASNSAVAALPQVSAAELLPDLAAKPPQTPGELATAVTKPEVTTKVIAGVTAAATMADRISPATSTTAPPGAKAEGIVQMVLPVAGAIAEVTGNKEAAKNIAKSQDAAAVALKLRDAQLQFTQAATTAQAIRDGAAAASTASSASSAASGAVASGASATNLSSFGRAAAGLDIARGVLLAPQLAKQVKALASNPKAIKNPDFVKSLAGNSMAVGNGFLGAARFVNRNGFAAKATPWVGSVADGALIAATVSDIRKNGLKAPNALELAAYSADLAGNAALLGGIAPAGLALKGASLGPQAVALGLRHKQELGKFAHKVGDKIENFKDKVSALV